MCTLLRPDGHMWHKVDLRCHGFFAQFGPLHFLRFGDRTWNRIASPDPTINRERRHVYEALCARDFGQTKSWATHVLDHDELVPHVQELIQGAHYTENDVKHVADTRPFLPSRFAALPDEELLCTGIFLIASAPSVKRPMTKVPLPR